MKSQWNILIFSVGAILIVVLVSLFYQPAAAKTGSLLVWLNNRIYVMDIDTLLLARVGPAEADDLIVPSPGCLGQTETPCWVVAAENLYVVDQYPANQTDTASTLPLGEGVRWLDAAAASWSPDGIHLAYPVFHEANNQSELRIYNAVTTETQSVAWGVDPAVAPAWTASCGAGLEAADCKLAFKTRPANVGGDEILPQLVAFTPATGQQRAWEIPVASIFELRWAPDGGLLYSQPKRHFRRVEDHSPAYQLPPASKLANMSPDANYTVYYQPFRLIDCQVEDEQACLHLGVWLTRWNDEGNPRLIYDVDPAQSETGGLNFVPIWSPEGHGFVFFQEGKLIYYDLTKQEATIWYKSVRGKLRSKPVFSPNEEAVAFVDNEGRGFSEYRLVVVNPRLQPVEHIINTKSGFRVLAWLPN